MSLKIAVYSCALNEEQFVDRWFNSAKDADQLLVLDTGSTDDTVAESKRRSIDVYKGLIKPWRFDDAKNAALHLLNADIDVAVQLDLDEVLTPNWRQLIEEAWTPETTKLQYKYVWSWFNNKPDRVFFADKIGGRFTHRWKNPVHEVLTPTIPEKISVCKEVLIEHHPDSTKSRSSYLGLLELSVEEDPFNDRNAFYLGREYYFYKHYEKAIAEFQRYIHLPTAKWISERAAAFRYGAKCYQSLNKISEAYNWLILATLEDPRSREALLDTASFLLEQKDWQGALYYSTRAMNIPADQYNYINERYALEEGPYDIASVALYYLGDKASALACAKKALEFNPTDQRLKANLDFCSGGNDEIPASRH